MNQSCRFSIETAPVKITKHKSNHHPTNMIIEPSSDDKFDSCPSIEYRFEMGSCYDLFHQAGSDDREKSRRWSTCTLIRYSIVFQGFPMDLSIYLYLETKDVRTDQFIDEISSPLLPLNFHLNVRYDDYRIKSSRPARNGCAEARR